MKKLLPYLKPYVKESILGPLFKLLEASFELLVPLVVAAVIDTGIAAGDTVSIWKMCGVLVLLGLVGMVCSITAQYFSAKAAVGFATRIRHALFAHIQTLSFGTLDKIGTSTLITRLTSDVNQVQSGLNLTLRLLLRSPFVVFGAMVMAFTIDVPSALIFAVTIPILCVIVFGIMLVSMPLYKKVQAQLDKVLGATRESLTGSRFIRAFRMEEAARETFDERNQSLTTLQRYVGRISALMNPVTYIIINAAVIVLIYTGAIRVETGIITQGALVALYNYMSQILVELVKMANMIIQLTKAAACARRISDVLNTEPGQSFPETDPAEKSGENVPAVQFRHVSLRYGGAGDESLTDINITVPAGSTVGIIGGTGSGKSSLVSLIPRFYDATAGEVLVNGINVRDYPASVLRGKIGYVLQKALLFHGTIRENLRWGNPDASDGELLEAAELAQAGDITARKGLDHQIEQEGRNLSGGQRQRLTIARALVRKPAILILDDSASALDLATDAALRRAIAQIPYHPTVFIVSQRTSSLQHADQILVLDDGMLVGRGTHEELLASCEIYREIHQSQTGTHTNPAKGGAH
ncbi:MAG: ABC transporter ATP-binding protein [Clostridia bacterium]|nr:ABC transporter ATP-binding protein [Clostridia bacterium]